MQQGYKICQCVDDILFVRLEVGEVLNRGAWLVQVGLVDEVPRALEATERPLDIVGEGGALGEGVIHLVFNHVRVRLCQGAKLGEGEV